MYGRQRRCGKKEPQMGLAHIQVAISENNKAFHVCGNAFIVPIL
jgi:hypothetical protein